jgi:hypothetical protein
MIIVNGNIKERKKYVKSIKYMGGYIEQHKKFDYNRGILTFDIHFTLQLVEHLLNIGIKDESYRCWGLYKNKYFRYLYPAY